MNLPIGKLPAPLLKRLLDKVAKKDEQVILWPSIGEDVAVIRVGGKLLVAKTDPVTFASDLIGWYAVHVNANDMATAGVRPRWFLATILLPEGCEDREAEQIFDQLLSACNKLDISLVGGHTEITYDFKRPVIVGTMLGETEDRPIITTSGARPGDDIVLTKGIAIEGMSVLAREAKQALVSAGIGENTIKRAADYLFTPGISVLEEALTACSVAAVSCMHDPTEGGLATGLAEIATAAGVGISVEKDKIPILPECQEICDALKLDPLGMLASGAMIITLPPPQSDILLERLSEISIKASVIGRVAEAEQGLKMITSAGTKPLPRYERDELARFLDETR
jgi:hydrogenase maturation factor